jgi:hypothetical protein
MVQRCNNSNDRSYARYGGRGISVCTRWLLFENFYADMGEKPKGLSLERRDNDAGYSPDNCYWAPLWQQSRNKRSTVRVVIDGQTVVLVDALNMFGATIGRIHYWMKKLETNHQGVIDVWLRQKKVL